MEKELPTCKHCQEPFKPKRTWQEFCKRKCRQDFHYKERLRLIELGKSVLK